MLIIYAVANSTGVHCSCTQYKPGLSSETSSQTQLSYHLYTEENKEGNDVCLTHICNWTIGGGRLVVRFTSVLPHLLMTSR